MGMAMRIDRVGKAEGGGRLDVADVVGKGAPAIPISAPEMVVAISFRRKVGTPQASAASSSSRMLAKP